MGNSNEEKSREIVEKFVDSGHIYDEEFEKVERAISKALASAENKGREDEQPKAFGSGFTSGWNEAIEAARKVAKDKADNDFKCICGLRIAESINKLKRG